MDIGPLLRRALTQATLREAWRKVADNRGMAGSDGETIPELANQLDTVLPELALAVVDGSYRPQPLLRIWIPRPGKSPRGLAVPSVRDRVLQTSVTLTLTPKVESELADCAYAYRHGRGVRQAVERIGYYQRAGYRWVVDADIESFFDTIPHDALLDRLGQLVQEPALLSLIRQWLNCPIVEEGRITVPSQGIPQGSPISPLLANLYLDTLDDALLDADHVLIRYADDFVVLARSQARAEAALELTREVLERLALKLNPIKTRIVNLDQGLEFLGWHFVRSIAVPARWRESDDVPAAPPDRESAAARAADTIENRTGETALLGAALGQALAERPDWQAGDEDDGDPIPLAEDEVPLSAELPPLSPLQRTLYLVDPRARLSAEGGRFCVEREGRTVLALPPVNVDQIMVFGPIQVTTQALHLAAKHDCAVSFLSWLGRCRGRFEPPGGASLSLLQSQVVRQQDAAFALGIACRVVAAKLHNSRCILARSQRHHRTPLQHAETGQRLRELETDVMQADRIERLRGLEGAAAALYWRAFAELVPPQWSFQQRVAHPAPDPVNALLSLGYSLLYHCVGGLLGARGLDARLGFLHAPGGNHMALASDLMEAFRAQVVDATVLRLLHTGRLSADGHHVEDGRCRLSEDAVRIMIQGIEDRFNAVARHPQTQVSQDLRRTVDHDVTTLIAALKDDDTTRYQPTRWH